jgi:hypothetical protein
MIITGDSGAETLLFSPLFRLPEALDVWEFTRTLKAPKDEFVFFQPSNVGPLFVLEFRGVDTLEPMVVQDVSERARLKELILSTPTELWLGQTTLEGDFREYVAALWVLRMMAYLPPFPKIPAGHPVLQTHRLYSFHWPREGGVTVTDTSFNPPWVPCVV